MQAASNATPLNNPSATASTATNRNKRAKLLSPEDEEREKEELQTLVATVASYIDTNKEKEPDASTLMLQCLKKLLDRQLKDDTKERLDSLERRIGEIEIRADELRATANELETTTNVLRSTESKVKERAQAAAVEAQRTSLLQRVGNLRRTANSIWDERRKTSVMVFFGMGQVKSKEELMRTLNSYPKAGDVEVAKCFEEAGPTDVTSKEIEVARPNGGKVKKFITEVTFRNLSSKSKVIFSKEMNASFMSKGASFKQSESNLERVIKKKLWAKANEISGDNAKNEWKVKTGFMSSEHRRLSYWFNEATNAVEMMDNALAEVWFNGKTVEEVVNMAAPHVSGESDNDME